MEHELAGLHGSGGRWRPVGAGPFALLAVALALSPIRPVWLWAALIAVAVALPWGLAAIVGARVRPYWRLSPAGLERVPARGPGEIRYARSRIEQLALTTADDGLTVVHKFGRTPAGTLRSLGMEPLALFVTARRLGIPVQVLDGETADLLDPAVDDPPPTGRGEVAVSLGPLPPDHAVEQRLLDQEARLLEAAHSPGAADAPPGGKVRLSSPSPLPGGRRAALLGLVVASLGVAMVVRIAAEDATDFGARLAAGCWALAAILGVLVARRRVLATGRVHWTITADGLSVRTRPGPRAPVELPAARVAALVVGPGLRLDALTGQPRPADPAVLVFGHRLELLARLPAHGLDAFQLVHALDDHGYHVVTPGAPAPRTPEYGLEGLPEIFAQVPGGRLVVADDGLGWADAAGDVVLRMPPDRVGGIELLTIAGHAWVRLYDADGDEFFAAPLSALRIPRTELREAAKAAGLPVTDAEYDAYLNAAFHSAVAGFTEPEQPRLSPSLTAPGVTLDATRRSRAAAYVASVLLGQIIALAGALWAGPYLGGFSLTASWAVPAGLLASVAGAWLYDRNRAQLRVSSAGVAVVTRRGRLEWDVTRDRVGGVGIDDSTDRLPRLVVWGPSGRVLRQVGFPPDLIALRRACEKHGLPWGPPDATRPAPPPPEL